MMGLSLGVCCSVLLGVPCLVRLEQLHIGRDDVTADVLQHLRLRKELVVHGGGDGRQKANGRGDEQVVVRSDARAHLEVSRGGAVEVYRSCKPLSSDSSSQSKRYLTNLLKSVL